jgi:tetratricopeptide (TPR) repeat protein
MDSYAEIVRAQISEAYQKALQNPKEAEANGRLGMLLYAYEQYEYAEPCFERARAFAASDERWAYYLGRTQANLRRCDRAVASLQEALRRDPNYLPARLKLGECLLEAGKPEESRKIFQEIADKHPDEASAHYGLGKIYAARREFAAAIEHLRRACDLFPSFGAAHFALAAAYRDTGAMAKAQEELASYQKDRLGWPTTPDPLLMAMLDLKTGAIAHLRKGIDLAETGQLEAAAEEHERALAADSKLVQAHVHLITLYAKLGRTERAEEHYRAALALDPNLAEIHYNFGVLLTGQMRYAEAAEAFRRALELNPSYAEAHNNYAYLLMITEKLDEASQHYIAAIANKPGFRAAHFNLGRILVQQGKIQDAIDHFLQTLTPEDEETPRCMYALGAAYARAGNRDSALKYTKEARRRAAALGQTDLLEAIDKDLRLLEQGINPP